MVFYSIQPVASFLQTSVAIDSINVGPILSIGKIYKLSYHAFYLQNELIGLGVTKWAGCSQVWEWELRNEAVHKLF